MTSIFFILEKNFSEFRIPFTNSNTSSSDSLIISSEIFKSFDNKSNSTSISFIFSVSFSTLATSSISKFVDNSLFFSLLIEELEELEELEEVEDKELIEEQSSNSSSYKYEILISW